MTLSLKTIIQALILVLVSTIADSRECLTANSSSQKYLTPGKTEVKIVAGNSGSEHFQDPKRRCSYYWPYFAGKIKKTDGSVIKALECRLNIDQVNLTSGYTPLGVFFKAIYSKPYSEVSSYSWEIRGPVHNETAPLMAKFESFNAAMIFEAPGEYSVNLEVNFTDYTSATDSITVNVWPRDSKTYFVDSKAGDDRYNGLSEFVDNTCQPDSNPIGVCQGPWKTATRAFSTLAPRDWRKKATSTYRASSVCHSFTTKKITRYAKGEFSIYKGSSTPYPEALKDKHGVFLPSFDADICTKLIPSKKTLLKPGDQILFRRGQTFELETGIFTLKSFERELENKQYKYEQLKCSSLISTGHWPKIFGILFGAFGEGGIPKIKNSGNASCAVFRLGGVGLLHLAFQDLNFNLESKNSPEHADRSSFLFTAAKPTNLVFNRIALTKFNQGILFHNASGMFLSKSYLHDSNVVHLYSNSATDVALIDNKFDYSGNHIAYTNFRNGLVLRNKFSRQAFGRTALRITGSGLDKPTASIWISDNSFEGWIDPRTREDCSIKGRCQFANGTRYNYSLVEIKPNTLKRDKFSDNIVFKNNVLMNAENMLWVGAVSNLHVENNKFQTLSTARTARVLLHSDGSRRPLRNLIFKNNDFAEGSRNNNPRSNIIHLTGYKEPACEDMKNHDNVVFINNTFHPQNMDCIFGFKESKTSKTSSCLLDQNGRVDKRLLGTPYITINNNYIKRGE